MTRDDDAVGGEVKTPKSLMIRRITQENTKSGARGKFVRGSGGHVRITSTAKDPKVGVGGMRAEQGEVRSGELRSFSGETV